MAEEREKWVQIGTTVIVCCLLIGVAYWFYRDEASHQGAAADASKPAVEISIEVNVGEILGGLLVGVASMLAAVSFWLRGRSNSQTGQAPNGGKGPSTPSDPNGAKQTIDLESAVKAAEVAKAQAVDAASRANAAREQAEHAVKDIDRLHFDAKQVLLRMTSLELKRELRKD